MFSERAEDEEFFGLICKLVKIPFFRFGDEESFFAKLKEDKKATVIWDGDSILAHSIKIGLGSEETRREVFILTDEVVNHYAQHIADPQKKYLGFRHNLVRRFNRATALVYARLLLASLKPKCVGLATYFPKNTKIHTIVIRKSDDKNSAVTAILTVLRKHKVITRVASRAAQAVDELLMNALFDAPHDKLTDKPLKKFLKRDSHFALRHDELVVLEFAVTDDYIGVCVTDPFGSLNVEMTYRYLIQNYQTQDYKMQKSTPGSGLGLYQNYKSGLSLLIACEPGKRTDVQVFFPTCKSYKEFRKGFQFLTCFMVK